MADFKTSDFIEEGFLDKEIAKMKEWNNVAKEGLKNTRVEAEKVMKALEGVRTSQESGQKTVEESEKRVESLVKAEKKYQQTLDDTEQEIVKLKAAQQEQNRINKLTEKLNRSLEGSYDKLSAQYSLNKIELNKMSKEQRSATKAGQDLEKNTAAIYEEMKGLQEATGKHSLSVGDYAGQIETLIPSLGGAANGVKALGTQLWALVANPIGAIIAAVVLGLVGLWNAFKNTAGGAALLEKGMAALAVIFETVLGRLGDFIQGEISFIELLTETDEAIAKNVKASNDLVDARRNLAKATADSELAESRYGKEVAKLQAIRDSDARSLSERQEAAVKLAAFESKEAKEVVNRAKLNEDIARREFLLARSKGKTSEEARLASIEYTKALTETTRAEAQLIAVQAESANQLQMIRLDIFEQDLDLLLDITDRQKSINERRIADERTTIEEKRRLAQENVDIIEDAFDKQIIAFEELNGVQLDEVKLLQMSGAEIRQYADGLGFSERAVNRLREVVIEKLAADQDNLETLRDIEKQEAAMSKAREERASKQLQQIRSEGLARTNQLKELALSEIDLLEVTEEEKTKLRLIAERDRLMRVIALNKNLGGVLSDLQVETMKNTIEKINKEIENLSGSDEAKTVWDYIGLNNKEEQQAANEAVGIITSSLNQVAQDRVNTANTAVESTNRELESARQYYEEQKALMEEGEANSFAFAERRLEQAEKNNAKAEKERERAVRAQERLDTIQQVVSLTTASANIFKALSGAGPIGIALAIGSIAAMFGAFASSKIQARKASRSRSYGDGGDFDVTGGSHASGNDVSLGVHNGVERRVEGGEKVAILSKRAVRKYGRDIGSIVKSLNDGSFEKMFGNTMEVSDDMREFALNGGSTIDAMRSFWQAENEKNRAHMDKAIKSMPKSDFNITNQGITEYVRKGNTTTKRIRRENRYFKK